MAVICKSQNNDMSSKSNPKNKYPEWAATLFDDYLDHLKQLEQILNLSIRGIGMIGKRHIAVEAVGKLGDQSVSEYKEKLKGALKDRELAE